MLGGLDEAGGVHIHGDAASIAMGEWCVTPAEQVSGTIEVDHDLEEVHIQANEFTGWLIVHGNLYHGGFGGADVGGTVEIDGNVELGVEVWSPFSGRISVGNDLDGHLDLRTDMKPGAEVSVGHDVNGPIQIGTYGWYKEVNGTIEVGNDLRSRLRILSPMSGDLWVRGNMTEEAYIVLFHESSYEARSVDLEGSIIIDGNASGHIEMANLDGSLTVGGDMSATVELKNGYNWDNDLNGTITIGGDMRGRIFVDQDTTSTGMTGQILIDGSLCDVGEGPEIEIVQSMWPGAVIDVNHNLDGTVSIGGHARGDIKMANLNGSLAVAGDLFGTVELKDGDSFGNDLNGTITIGGNMRGQILIDGGFFDVDAEGPEIEIVQAMIGGALIAVNYDGPNPDDHEWHDGAVVRINGVNYTEPDESEGLWEVTCLKGDMNNSGTVNTFDSDPFVLALTDEEAYLAAYPGLAGSFVYLGDMNCNDYFNTLDIDAFVLRLTDPDEYYETYDCEVCPGERDLGGGGIDGDPEDVAAMFKEYVAEARLPVVVEIAAELAAYYGDTPRAEFWAAVLAELK